MLGWFQALLPREDNFFRLFNAHAPSPLWPHPRLCNEDVQMKTAAEIALRRRFIQS